MDALLSLEGIVSEAAGRRALEGYMERHACALLDGVRAQLPSVRAVGVDLDRSVLMAHLHGDKWFDALAMALEGVTVDVVGGGAEESWEDAGRHAHAEACGDGALKGLRVHDSDQPITPGTDQVFHEITPGTEQVHHENTPVTPPPKRPRVDRAAAAFAAARAYLAHQPATLDNTRVVCFVRLSPAPPVVPDPNPVLEARRRMETYGYTFDLQGGAVSAVKRAANGSLLPYFVDPHRGYCSCGEPGCAHLLAAALCVSNPICLVRVRRVCLSTLWAL